SAAIATASVDDRDVGRREPLAQPLDQRVVEIDAPLVGQLEVAADAVALVMQADGRRAAAIRREDLLEAVAGRVAVAGKRQAPGEALARVGEVVDGLDDDAKSLRLAL